MRRAERFEDLFERYEGREYEKAPGYKKNFCMVFDERFLSVERSDVIRANIKKILHDLPRDKSYAYIHTEQADKSILTPWIDDLESVLKLDEAELRKKQKRYAGTAFALKELAKDRQFSGMIITDWLIEPIHSNHTYQAIIELSKRENKFCVIYFHDSDNMMLVDPLMFSSIDPYADRYHVTCVKDMCDLMNEYISYAIHGKDKPKRFNEATK